MSDKTCENCGNGLCEIRLSVMKEIVNCAGWIEQIKPQPLPVCKPSNTCLVCKFGPFDHVNKDKCYECYRKGDAVSYEPKPEVSEIRAEVRHLSKWYEVVIFQNPNYTYYFGRDENNEPELDQNIADLICRKINAPDPIAIIEEMEKEASPLMFSCLEELKRRLTGGKE